MVTMFASTNPTCLKGRRLAGSGLHKSTSETNMMATMMISLLLLLTLAPVQFVSGEHTCRDDPDYRYNGQSYHDCDWIETYNRCDHKDPRDSSGKIGVKYCPVSCGDCPNTVSSSSVSVDSTCYEHNQQIVVSFKNKYPREDDWIGIYPSSSVDAGDSTVGSPTLWLWNCNGDQENEFCKVLYGKVTFGSNYPSKYGQTTFPLPPGTYRAVLAKDGNAKPYDVIAISDTFTVDYANQGCHSHQSYPTPNPAPEPTPKPVYHYPTPNPVSYPTANPVQGPTSQCDSADEFIKTDYNCYAFDEPIKVDFKQCNPRSDDWIAVYKEGSTSSHLVGYKYQFWVYACGTQSCRGKKYSGTVKFDEYDPVETGYDIWPLEPGKYIAYLVRDSSSPPYTSYLQSQTFTVKDSGEYCSRHPTPQPVPYPTSKPVSYPTPTRYPSVAPSRRPSPSPQHPQCALEISTDYKCYYPGESVEVTFNNCKDVDERDWIGIFPASEDPDELSSPLVWLYACGTQSCRADATSGTVVFGYGGPNERGTLFWPLPSGKNYRAYLIKDLSPSGKFMASAMSEEFFFLKKATDTCDGDNNGSRSRSNSRKR